MLDWVYGLAGGLMIGIAAALFLLNNGRIMGASGILGGVVDGTGRSNFAERIAFLFGLIAVPAIVVFATGARATYITDNWAVIIVSGLLVGIGTRLANGCTSGHGVCGISRLSMRGIGATAIYLVAGTVVMLIARHALGII